MEVQSKIYGIDTNIILDDAENIIRLADNGQNIICITETTLAELDKFKSGNEEINYQARQFNRMLNESKVVKKFSGRVKLDYNGITIIIFETPEKIRNADINNDLKIIRTFKNYLDNDAIILSNDILFRTYVLLYTDFKTEPLLKNENKEIVFYKELQIENVLPNKDYYTENDLGEIEPNISYIKVTDGNGKPFFFIRRQANLWQKLNDRSSMNLFGIKPMNLEQQVYLEHLLNMDNDIIVVDALAGSMKTLGALVAAMKLKQQGKIDKIIYIRKTIISGDNLDELGFLPGNLDEKLEGYIHPLRDNLELIIKLKNKKKKNWTKDEIDEAIEKLEKEFNIEYIYSGHLRGRNLKGFIIFDEAQNSTIADLKTLLSRLVDGSRIAIIGSTKQIDNPYLNKHNNALTFMKNQCGTFSPIQIQGIALHKVYRGKIPEWIETLF